LSIWGKVIGGVAGFALGGPLGALMGALAGHAVDQMKEEKAGRADDEARQAAFATAVIVLSAKMAKADGRVTRAEINAFKRLFHIPPDQVASVGRLFDEARREAGGFEPYARQVARLFVHNPAVLEELLDCLFLIAQADGALHPAETDFLHRVAVILGLSERAFERLRAGHARRPREADPYAVLGVSRDAPDARVKAAWRRLVRENHPDALIAEGMPKEFVDVANRKAATINAAWDRIRKERRI
jgi:DnaJ like chaperone protein